MEIPTILIIDDNPSNIDTVVDILLKAELPCEILSSSKSTVGFEIAIKKKPTLIISDWEMPEMNGIELITELKKNENTKEIPVIIVTGVNLSFDYLKQALDMGAYDFIRKPINEVELIARINSAIRFVDYYNKKIEAELTTAKTIHEKLQSEIDLKKKEVLSKTMMLIKINKSFEKFHESASGFKHLECQKTCRFSENTRTFFNETIAGANKQIWEELELHFEQVSDTFYKNLLAQFPALTKNERKLCAYLRLNLSTKDIASLTFQSYRSIEMARIRLRDKLGLKGSSEDLNSFLLNF